MRYLYIDSNNILKTFNQKIYHYTFTSGDSSSVSTDTSRKVVNITVAPDMSYSDLPNSLIERSDNTTISLNGTYILRDRIDINGVYYYFRATNSYTDQYLFTCIISAGCEEPYFQSLDEGEFLIVPSDYAIEDYIDFINTNSSAIYLEMKPDYYEYQVSNIFGLDLLTCKTEYIINDTTPYDNPNRVFLDEPMQIACLIQTLRREYPNIQFYTNPNDRDNTDNTNEYVYYQANLFDDYNMENGVLRYRDPFYGRVAYEPISIDMRYETPDMIEFLNKRNEFLMNKFLSNVSVIYPDVHGRAPISIGVSWDRNQNEVIPDKIQDQSDRVTYSFNVRCTLQGLLIEKYEQPERIDHVLYFIYGPRSKDLIDLSKITTVINGKEDIEYESPSSR